MHKSTRKKSQAYRKIWARDIGFENTTNIVDYVLAQRYKDDYLDAFFRRVKFEEITSLAVGNLCKNHTTILGKFTFADNFKV